MSNATISVDIELNASKALENVNSFTDGVKGKISEIDQVISNTNENLSNIQSTQSIDPRIENAAGVFSVLTDSLTQMKDGLTSVSNLLNSGVISNSMTGMFESMYRTITSSMQKINNYTTNFSNKFAQSGVKRIESFVGNAKEQEMRLVAASGMKAASDAKIISDFISNISATGGLGIQGNELDAILPAIRQMTERKISNVQQALKGTASIDDITRLVSNDKTYRNALSGVSGGRQFTDLQAKNIVKLFALGSRYSSLRDSDLYRDQAGFEEDLKLFQTDYFPKAYQAAFTNYGYSSKNKQYNQFADTLVNGSAYKALRNLVRGGNSQAIRLAEKVGLVRANNGQYEFSGSANYAQMETLAGLAMQSIRDSKTSLPYYYVDPNDITKEETLMRRQNKVYQEDMEIVNALAKHNITPNIYSGGKGHRENETADQIINGNLLYQFNENGMQKYNRNPIKIKTLGTKDMYVVPQTMLGEDNDLIYRDEQTWRKTNGIKKSKEDYFVTIGRSAMTDLLGLTGNNTYGFGRDAEGRAIYDTPPIIRINTSDLYGEIEDENGKQKIGILKDKEELAKKYNRLFNREETALYGRPGEEKKEYIAAYADEENLIMVLKDKFDTINKDFKNRGLQSPFENMNIGGRFGKGTFSGAMKAVDLQRKGWTPGHRYEDLGYKDIPDAALVDFSNLYEYAGITKGNAVTRKNERIDGVSYFDPSVMPFNAQMRAGFIDKFMGQREDWRKLLMGSGLLEQAYNSKQNRGLIDINPNNRMAGFKNGYSFYVPQIGLEKDFVKATIDRMNQLASINTNEENYNDARLELEQLRKTYFYDIMDPHWKALITDTSVKNDDKWRLMTRENFEIMKNSKDADLSRIFKSGPAKIKIQSDDPAKEILELTSAQQAAHFKEAAKASGLWINNSAYDFKTDKDFIPESLATAMGLGIEERTKSNVAYKEYIDSLKNDQNARRDYLLSMGGFGRMLVESGQEDSSMANKLIQARISDMEAKKANGHLYVPGMGPEIALTGAMPGSLAGPVFEKLFGATVDKNQKYGKLFSYTSDEDRVLMRTMTDEQKAILKNNAIAARLMISRMPAAPGEYSPDAKNLGDFKIIQRAMDALGMEYDDTIYTNPNLQYRLMTGDYDGDTAWIVKGLSSNAVERMRNYVKYKQNAADEIAKRNGGRETTLPERQLNKDTIFTDSQVASLQSVVDMGLTTSAIRNAMVGMDDNDPKKWLTIAQAINEYDLATSDTKKKGASLQMSKTTSDAARQGALFRRFVKQINAFADEDSNAKPRIFSSRLPLLNESSELADIAFNFAARRKGEAVGDVFGSHLDEWLRNQYGDMDTYEAKAAQQYASMMKNMTSGYRLNNRSDIEKARDAAFNWSLDIEKRRLAGDDVSDEQSRLNGFVYRLGSLEREGATYENISARRDALISRQKQLKTVGTQESLSEANNLQGLIDVYSGLLTPFSDQMEKVNAEWEKEQATLRDEVKARVEEANKTAKEAGIDTSKNVGLMNRVFARNPEAQAKMNWSDVTPWVYEEMLKDRVAGKHFALSGIVQHDLIKGRREVLPGDEWFNPYPHNDAGIDEQRVKIMARELGHGLGIIPDYETTGATIMGTIRHNTFEEYLKERMAGKKNIDISSIYAGALSSNGYDGLDLSVEQKEDGTYVLKGLDANDTLAEGINKALGTWDSKNNKFVGGTLNAFANNVIERTLANGGRIANIEARNYEYDNAGNIRVLNDQEISGRGAKILFDTSYQNASGLTVQKSGTFAPDLILADANNNFDMYDYKSGRAGAMDALFQMMVYAKDIQRKATDWKNIKDPVKKAKQKDLMEKYGWNQYVDANGNLKFKSFHAFDTSTGQDFELAADQKIIDQMYDYYVRGQQSKMHSAKSGEYLKRGAAYLQEQLDSRGMQVRTQKTTGDMQGAIYRSSMPGSDSYKGFLAQKFGKDEDTLKEINSAIFRQNMKFSNTDFGGYSQFSQYRKQLDEMISPDTIEKLKKEFEGDPNAVAELLNFQTRVRSLRDNLTANERVAAVKGFEDISPFIRQQMFGTKESSGLGAIESIRKRIENTAAIREEMMENPDQYNKATQKWVSSAAEKAYNDSLAAQANVEKELNELLPDLTSKQIKDNNKRLKSLIPKENVNIEEKIQDYYSEQYDRIEAFIKQQESYIQEYQNALTKKNKDGSLYFAEGSKQRDSIKEMLENAQSSREQAVRMQVDQNGIKEEAQRKIEKELGFRSVDKKTKAANQKEYAKILTAEASSDYQEALELYSMFEGDEDENYRREVESMLASAQKKMDHAKNISDQASRSDQIEKYQNELNNIKNRQSMEMRGLTQEEKLQSAVDSKMIERERYINDQLELDSSFNADEYRKKYSKEYFTQNIKNQMEEEAALIAMQRQNSLANTEAQGDIRVHNMQRAYNQANRQQQMRYNRSRVIQAIYGVEQRRENAREQIYSIDRQKEDVQRNQDYYAKQLDLAKKSGDQEKINAAQFGYDQATQQMTNLNKASEEAHRQLDELNQGGQTAQAVFSAFGQTIGMVAQRLGRQLFQKALQETKRFVKEFDASMNEIQAITLKSNDEMASIRSGTINKALGLRTSVSNVANVEAALYRQGLSDEEVSTRTESIIKFATVTKLNVQEATKIITTALQNDLVPSAEAAMDALVALGDSAATTAAEIGKGMQKAAASAKVAGVSYAELTALLTIGTSDTQLSGTQVGTALQTVFTRMRRMSQSGWAADQNGTKTTASDAEAALKSVGIDLFDNKAQGKMRSAYDILLDLSKVWQTLSDVQKSIVTSALAGTRQTNIFSTLMEGMSEDNGKTLEKYLGLAEGSEGITQSKYEVAMQSLAAAMDELKSSWDAVVESFTNGGLITSVLNTFSSFLQDIASAAENGGQIGLVFSVIAGGIAAITAKLLVAKSTLLGPISGLISLFAGLAVSLGGVTITKGLTDTFANLSKTEDQRKLEEAGINENKTIAKANHNKKIIDNRKKAIEDVEKAGEAWNKAHNMENENALRDALDNLLILFPDLSAVISNATSDLTKWKTAVEDAKNVSEQFVKETAKDSFIDYFKFFRNDFKYILQGATASILTAPISKSEALKGLDAARLSAPVYADGTLLKKYQDDAGVLSTIWNNSNYSSTKAIATEYLSAYDKDVLALLNNPDKNMDGSYGKTQYTEEELAMLAAAFTGFESYLNTPDSPYVAISEVGKKIKSTKGTYSKVANAYFNEDGSFAFEGYEKEGIKNKADLFRMLFYSDDESILPYLKSLFPNVNSETIDYLGDEELAGYMDTVVEGMANTKSARAMRMASTKAVQSEVEKSMPFQTLADDEFSEDILRNAFSSWVGNLLEEDYAKEEKDRKYFNADGTLKLDELTNTIEGKAYSIIYNDEERRKFVNENASDEFFYTVGNATGENGKKLKFTSVEKAAEYARKNGYEYTDIKDSNGNTAYTTADKAIEAAAASKREDKTAENLDKVTKLIADSTSAKDLKDKYDKEGLGQELANVLASNAELFSAYQMVQTGRMTWEDFQETASNVRPGRASNKSDVVEAVLAATAYDKNFVTSLRTDPVYAGVYATFKDVLGDAADAVLNAIEDGVSDPDAMRMLNQALVSQRIKEAMQFNRYYDEAVKFATTAILGSDTEKMELQASTKSELQQFYDYAASVERYQSGNALSSDYATIAAYDKRFTETELRNNSGNEDFIANVVGGKNTLARGLEEKYQADFVAALAAIGLTPEEYFAGDLDTKKNITWEQARLLAEANGANPNEAGYGEAIKFYKERGGMTMREAANAISPTALNDIDKMFGQDSPFNVVYDEKTGSLNFELKPGKELRMSGSAIVSQIGETAREGSAKASYKKLFQAIYSGTPLTTQGISEALGEEEFARLIQNDPMLGYMLSAGASPEEIRQRITLGAQGIQGNVFDQYGLGWDTLFGGNRELGAGSIIQARDAYKNIKPEDKLYFDAFLNELPQEIRDAITSETELSEEGEKELLKRFAEFRLKTTNAGLSEKELANILEQSTVEYGTEEEQRSLMSGKYQRGQAIQQANYALENFNDDTIGYITSLLEMPEEVVRKMMEEEGGKDKLAEMIKGKSEDFIEGIAKAFDIDLTDIDPSEYADLIRQKATELGGEIGDWLNRIADMLDEEGKFVAKSGYSSFDVVAEQRLKTQREHTSAMNVAGNIIRNGNYEEIGSNEDVNWNAIGEGLFYMMNDRRINGANSVFTDEMINAAYNQELLNGQLSPESEMSIINSIFGEANTPEERIQKYRELMSDEEGNAAQISALRSISGFEPVLTALANGTIDKVDTEWQQFNKNFSPRQIEYLGLYGESSSDVAGYITQIGKSSKTSTQAIGTLVTKMSNLSYQNKIIQGAAGKNGKQLSSAELDVISAVTSIPKEVLKTYGSDMMASVLEGANESIADQWETEVAAPLIAQINSTFENADENKKLQISRAIEFNIDAETGALDVAGLAEMVKDLDSELYQVLLAYANSGATLTADFFENGNDVGYVLKLKEAKAGTKGAKTGGGGGGGKSKADKLIEEQKHKVAEIEHESKMLQIDETRYDKLNDYDNYISTIDKEIEAQKRLEAQYAANIQEMNDLLAKTKEGSDDWWKLKESINSAEEAMKSVGNTIDELNAKNITMLSKQQDIQDKPGTHVQNMLEKLASRAMSEDRFNDYVSLTQDQIRAIQSQKDLNDAQIEEWKAQLSNYVEGSDSWLEVRDKIWALEEENAELENKALQQTTELNEQRLSQISKIVQENTQTAVHNQNVASTYGSLYQNGGYRNQYEDMIRVQIGSNASIKEQNDIAAQSVLAQMSTLEAGTTAWFNAQAALYSYQEAAASATATQYELNRALAESNLESVTERYTDATREIAHVNDMLSKQSQEYLNTNDYEAYYEAMERYLDNLPALIESKQTQINELWGQYNQGMQEGLLDPAMQRQYLDAINSAESEMQDLILDQRQKPREVDKTMLDKMLEDQDFVQSNYEHNLKLLGFESSKFQNAGELTNYGNMLSKDTELRTQRVIELGEEIDELEEKRIYYQQKYGEGSDEEKRIVEQIKKREEALASENTQIEKNNKLLEENRKKILQVRKTLQDAVDKEIEDQKRRQREILSANVTMQNTIVDLLKKSLQDQWNLRKKDLQQEKDSLNEYKKLINERFNYRKKAAQQEDKDEELADYRKQLALIQADPTRTKEARELQRKIDELQKNQAWTIAEDELAAENERIDQQTEGIDKFVQYNEELLNEILGDANNFSTEMNEILSGSFEESYSKILEYMSKENEAFMKSLPDAQQQMIQGWEDTWKKANDIIDNNYPFISMVLGNKESYMDYMKATDRMYRSYMENGDETNVKLLETQWSEYYDNYLASIKDTAIFNQDDHTIGEVTSKIDELKDNVFNVNIIGISGEAPGPEGLSGDGTQYIDFSHGDGYNLNDYAGTGKVVAPEPVTPAPSAPSGSGKKDGNSGNKDDDAHTYIVYGTRYDGLHQQYGKGFTINEAEEARTKAEKRGWSNLYIVDEQTGEKVSGYSQDNTGSFDNALTSFTNGLAAGLSNLNTTHGYEYVFNGKNYSENGFDKKSAAYRAAKKKIDEQTQALISKGVSQDKADIAKDNAHQSLYIYKHGGLVDYTGTAWVDGTPKRPESFLDAYDTETLRSMLDSFTYIRKMPFMSHVDSSAFGNNTTVGDVNIVINQADLGSDEDVDKVAKKVGKAFTKELRINGLNLSGYNFA